MTTSLQSKLAAAETRIAKMERENESLRIQLRTEHLLTRPVSDRIWQEISATLEHPDWQELKRLYEAVQTFLTTGDPPIQPCPAERIAELEAGAG